jgi:hypothetical protein
MKELNKLVELAEKADAVANLMDGVNPHTILAIAEAFRALEQRAEAAEAKLADQDYFASLVSKARVAADKAITKFPQPNYVLNKVSEEHGEVIKAVVHYMEGRETWENVEGELVDNLAMLIRLVVEGDQVIGFTPPESCRNFHPAPAVSLAALVPAEKDRNMIAHVYLDETTADKPDAYVKGFNACRAAIMRNIK